VEVLNRTNVLFQLRNDEEIVKKLLTVVIKQVFI